MPPNLPHLVIAGGSGFLGLTWAAAMQDRYRITLIQHKRHLVVPFASIVPADLSDLDAAHELLAALSPDILINAAGMTNVEACEADPEAAERANVRLPENLAHYCQSSGTKFLHVSTDHLFDGKVQWVTEHAVPTPLNVYAATKARSEQNVLDACPSALVVRSNFFGWGPSYKPSFSDAILSSVRAGKPIVLFKDVWFTPVLNNDLIELAHALIDHGTRGIVNLVGSERMNKFEFGLKLVAAFSLDQSLIRAGLLRDRNDLAKRPLDMSLDDSLLVSILGRRAPPIRDAFERMRRTEDREWIVSL